MRISSKTKRGKLCYEISVRMGASRKTMIPTSGKRKADVDVAQSHIQMQNLKSNHEGGWTDRKAFCLLTSLHSVALESVSLLRLHSLHFRDHFSFLHPLLGIRDCSITSYANLQQSRRRFLELIIFWGIADSVNLPARILAAQSHPGISHIPKCNLYQDLHNAWNQGENIVI
jgi:hypothetical protein